MSTNSEPFRALIVGGGVAGLEAALALRDLAGDRVQTTLLSPDPDFVYRPMTVREPFGFSPANLFAAGHHERHRGRARPWELQVART
jgi:sulfide:quinone oxidoreductase